jgi:hypothetical protein
MGKGDGPALTETSLLQRGINPFIRDNVLIKNVLFSGTFFFFLNLGPLAGTLPLDPHL